MNTRYLVTLTSEEESHLQSLLKKGKHSARKLIRAQILLLANEQQHTDSDICRRLQTSSSTVYRVKRGFVEEGLTFALEEAKRSGQPKVLSALDEAALVSIACSEPPKGQASWTLTLLADELVALTESKRVSLETIRQRLKANELKPWQKKMWCLGKIDANYIAQMEEILTLYAQPSNPDEPVINFDEAMKQLVSHTRAPIPPKPGQSERIDYEYKRESVANIFMMYDQHRGWRKTKVTTTKKREDFAECMKELVDVHYPNAKQLHVVLDNLVTHTPGSLYKRYPAPEARRILDKITFHYTPKHASWLNMVEIEIGIMNRQCLNRRIAKWEELEQELMDWEDRRNEEQASIKWLFDVKQARKKLNRAYAKLTCQN